MEFHVVVFSALCNTSLNLLLFLPLFPLHLNKVAGIVGRADLLCALFFQLSFLTYCKAFNRGRHLTPVLLLYLHCNVVLLLSICDGK